MEQLEDSQLCTLADELSGFVDQLRGIGHGDYVGSVDRGPCTDHLWNYNEDLPGGPFEHASHFHETIIILYHKRYPNNFSTFLRSLYPVNTRIFFTHGDLASRNIMVSDGHITGIIDWVFAGWYPEYWEYVKSLYGISWSSQWPLFVDKSFTSYHYELMLHNVVYSSLT
jgi:hypothetical protein